MVKRKRKGGSRGVKATPMGVAVTLGDPLVRVTLVEDEGPQPPPASGRGQPNPAPRKEQQGEQQGEKRAVPPGAHSCEFKGGNCLYCLSQATGETCFWKGTVGQPCHCSRVLLLRLGVPPTPAPAMLHTKSFPRRRGLEGAYHHIQCGKCNAGSGRWSGASLLLLRRGVGCGLAEWVALAHLPRRGPSGVGWHCIRGVRKTRAMRGHDLFSRVGRLLQLHTQSHWIQPHPMTTPMTTGDQSGGDPCNTVVGHSTRPHYFSHITTLGDSAVTSRIRTLLSS